MAEKVVITAALTGGAPNKDRNPNVPYRPEEYLREAVRAEEAGAAVVHIHFRNPDTGMPENDPAIMAEIMQALKEETNLLINLSTGFMGPGTTLENRKLPIEHYAPELASLNPGTMNFGFVSHRDGRIVWDFTFENPLLATIEFGTLMQEKKIKPEIECFCPSHVQNVVFFDKHYDFLERPLHFSFVFGVMGGVPFTPAMLAAYIDTVPDGSTWQGIGVGPFCYPVAMASAMFGGHIRVGLEDNLIVDYTTKEPSQGSWDQVEKAVQIAHIAGREVASPDEARVILNLPARD
jgi:3-keto-5-aminohexanoate cleavage enzyme